MVKNHRYMCTMLQYNVDYFSNIRKSVNLATVLKLPQKTEYI